MSVSLTSLITRLQMLAPARAGAPAEADYVQFVKNAVLQLSQDAPRQCSGSVSVVSGTASYALPGDFLFLIEWPHFSVSADVMVTSEGIVPMPTGWREEVRATDGLLTISPTPTYTMARTFRYAGAHVLSGQPGSEEYATLTGNGARIAMLYAVYLALLQQAQAAAGNAWRYQIGDEMVDKSRLGNAGTSAAQSALQSYRLAIQAVRSWV